MFLGGVEIKHWLVNESSKYLAKCTYIIVRKIAEMIVLKKFGIFLTTWWNLRNRTFPEISLWEFSVFVFIIF